MSQSCHAKNVTKVPSFWPKILQFLYLASNLSVTGPTSIPSKDVFLIVGDPTVEPEDVGMVVARI